jgi:mRNA interferase RelE/StbE
MAQEEALMGYHYHVLLLPKAERDLADLDTRLLKRFSEVLRRLGKEARPVGNLKLTNEEGYRIRVGDYRLLYRVDDVARKIFIYRIRHRRDVYR